MRDDQVLSVAINKPMQDDNTDQKRHLPLKCNIFLSTFVF